MNAPLTPSQIEAIGCLPVGKAPPLPAVRLTLPSAHYTDPARFEDERRAMFEAVPLLAGHSSLLPTPQSYATIELFGTPILLTRARDGQARAFLNVCRHRGTLLCPEAAGTGGRISCPYHAWTYGLTGELIGIPQAGIFAGVEKRDHDLVELPCAEGGGLIWLGIDPDRDIDFSEVLGPLAADFDAIGLGAMHAWRRTSYDVAANWKLVMDTMLDGYHVTRLHQNTLAKFFVDTPAEVRELGRHIRVVSARANFAGADGIDSFAAARRTTVFSYTLFPMGVVVVSPAYVNICILRPIDATRTAVDYVMLSDTAEQDAKGADILDRSFALMDTAFGKEDFWAAELGQKGLAKGRLRELLLGGMEVQMKQFHDHIDAAVTDGLVRLGNQRPPVGGPDGVAG